MTIIGHLLRWKIYSRALRLAVLEGILSRVISASMFDRGASLLRCLRPATKLVFSADADIADRRSRPARLRAVRSANRKAVHHHNIAALKCRNRALFEIG